ncbi:SET domain-containing protein-lysine N-methyltransferase [Mucilaginibacter jinjuensis]|uniref:SET domain-containing protein-lysine N-methyltransferase n=1 Tax=Mucilaginibacter jinjuensis TaxID=1176721 RepID=A0ABY7T6J4_9SPHI|nr:SET domain-containing protein-lysine N-methyltransferase [Mucilaginibacter jinjuensis]WCT11884.1 SET domain-containing protein-lysine N-methyltransferase [Mucilaginibacter jinjuensis]
MNDALKKQLQLLLEQHPELNNGNISFADGQITLNAAEETSLAVEKADHSDTVNKPGYLVDIIAGHTAKVEVRKSPVHGYGVFAKELIEAGELIEECRLLKLGYRANYNHDPVLKDYVWAGRDDGEQTKLHGLNQYLALGLGVIYNHSDQPNTIQNLDFDTEVMTIKARQPIQKGEEIFVTYGKKYFMIRNFWKNVHKNNELENFITKQQKAD